MLNNKQLSELRRNYTLKELSRRSVSKDPFEQFSRWFNEAMQSDIKDVNAMTIATAGKSGIPSARTVLLKGFDKEGFVFYTNYESSKGKDLSENPYAALLFYWKELERQIRITGKVKKISAEESAGYFNERPLESRLGAWASRQSEMLPDRKTLDKQFEYYKELFTGKEVTLPPYWGGYIVIPERIEYWQGRENRLHDRICYIKKENNWQIVRLAP